MGDDDARVCASWSFIAVSQEPLFADNVARDDEDAISKKFVNSIPHTSNFFHWGYNTMGYTPANFY